MSSILLERKLASKLWKLARDFGIPTEEGVEIDLNLTITFLADMLGVPRETTSRACTVLVDQGLIRMNRKRITIVDTGKIVHFFRTGSVV
jgi:CRP-like cAMP-binding protein